MAIVQSCFQLNVLAGALICRFAPVRRGSRCGAVPLQLLPAGSKCFPPPPCSPVGLIQERSQITGRVTWQRRQFVLNLIQKNNQTCLCIYVCIYKEYNSGIDVAMI